VNHSVREDRGLVQGTQKLFGIVIAFAMSALYTLSGLLGSVAEMGVGNTLLVIFQVTKLSPATKSN
jgi:hypothetical protein